MLTDLRHGARTLLHDKGWTAVVVMSLALGIGANTALFSAVNSLFLRKLQVRDPDTLVRLKWSGRNDMSTDNSDYEIGIRMALGARRQDVLTLVMGESMMLVAIGVVVGLGTAVAARRLVATLLFGLAATDGLTIGGAVTLMVLVSAVAGYVPARRAARVDPLVALHHE